MEYKADEGTYWKIPSSISVDAENKNASYLDFLQLKLFKGKSIRFVRQKKATIAFVRKPDLTHEAYEMKITVSGVQISAGDDAGFFYALRTLEQLMVHSDKQHAVACVTIADEPAYRWRTFMLDSGRQYQKVATIKKYLDMMAALKMNVFHWHLTEGLGWRIEIKKYPDLALKGSKVAGGPEQQGYYTREAIKEIVRYAAERYITVVPEIDMPGHAEAALSVYPEFSCFNEPAKIPENGFTPHIFCAGKTSTIRFLKDVIDEVCALFPSEYIHLGGDEAPKDNWDKCPDCQKTIQTQGLSDSHDLQTWFSNQMAEHLKSKGRKAIFWDDVIAKEGNAEISENAVIHWWHYRARQDKPLKKALATGREILCGTNINNYLNFPITPWKGYGQNRTFDMQEVYENNPSRVDASNPLVLGMSCSLWCDYGVKEAMIDQRLFPRILAISNQMWYRGKDVPFAEFQQRVQGLKPWFESQGYSFGPGLRSEVPVGYSWE